MPTRRRTKPLQWLLEFHSMQFLTDIHSLLMESPRACHGQAQQHLRTSTLEEDIGEQTMTIFLQELGMVLSEKWSSWMMESLLATSHLGIQMLREDMDSGTMPLASSLDLAHQQSSLNGVFHHEPRS